MIATDASPLPCPGTEYGGQAAPGAVRLGDAAKGLHGVVIKVQAPPGASSLSPEELERRLLEMGFVEGARVTLLHEGLIGRDPIGVQVDQMKVALRRREARGVWVIPE